MTPPTMLEADERGLLATRGEDVHTFSNGSEWDGWASANCYACTHWDEHHAGARCAFEAAAFLHCVSPALATLFGWEQRETQYGPRSGWRAPESCRFFGPRGDDHDDDETPAPPPPDPRQLVLFADPTEDLALFGQPARAPHRAVSQTLMPV